MSMSTFQIEKKEQKRHKKKTDSDGGWENGWKLVLLYVLKRDAYVMNRWAWFDLNFSSRTTTDLSWVHSSRLAVNLLALYHSSRLVSVFSPARTAFGRLATPVLFSSFVVDWLIQFRHVHWLTHTLSSGQCISWGSRWKVLTHSRQCISWGSRRKVLIQ
jgi:hypothetical protein